MHRVARRFIECKIIVVVVIIILLLLVFEAIYLNKSY